MADVVAARNAYTDARKLVKRARLELGRAIRDARGQGVRQGEIAAELELTREQVRRYEDEFLKATAGS